MKLTTRGRYAVTALLEIAMYGGRTPISLATISERQNLSLSYLEILFSQLRHGNLVKSHRGPGGGYVLVHTPDATSIAQIVAAVDKPREHKSSNLVMHNDQCFDGFLETDLWDELNEKMYEYLEKISLRDLLHKKQLVEKVQKRTVYATSPIGRAMNLVA